MSIDNMNDYNKLKERVISLKAVTEANRKTLEGNVSKFKTLIENIPDSSKTRLLEAGVDLRVLDTIDYNRLSVDTEYINATKKSLEFLILKCKTLVEDALND